MELIHAAGLRDTCPQTDHAFTTRRCGVSPAPFAACNLGLHVGDDARYVVRNREQVCRTLGYPFEAWTCGQQVHGIEVIEVTPGDRGRGRSRADDAVPRCDGLVTTHPGILLCVLTADCVPLLLADVQGRAVGACHAGWRGSLAGVARRAVRRLQALGVSPDDLRAVIGPAIGPCCYQVGQDVADAFCRAFGTSVVDRRPDGSFVDLAMVNRLQLVEAGLSPEAIETAPYCTRCRTDLFFSHRGESGRTGRQAGLIGLRPCAR